MPIRPQPLPIQFVGGVETKADGKGVPTTKLLDLQNAVFTKATTLSKRNGYEAYSTLIDETSADYGAPDGIAARGDELVAFSRGRGLSYRASADRWSDAGEVSSVVATATPVARTGTQQVIPDIAVRNGIMVVAWEDSRGGVWCSVLEDRTGRVLLADTQLDASGKHPRCIDVGEVVHVLWTRGDTNRIYVSIVNTADPTTVSAPAILVGDLSSANPAFDAISCGGVAYPDIRPGLIAWAREGGGFRVGYIHPAGALGSPLYGLPTVVTYTDACAGPIALTLDKAADPLVAAVVWCGAGSTSVNARILDDEFATTRGPVVLGGGSAGYIRIAAEFGPDGGSGRAVYWAAEASASRTDLHLIHSGHALQASSSADATSSTLRGHVLVTRAFYEGEVETDGHVYVGVAHAVQFFPYVAVVRLSGESFGGATTVAVARMLPGETVGAHFRRVSSVAQEPIKHVSSVIATLDGDDVYARTNRMPLSYRIQLDSEDGDQFSEAGIMLVTLDFDNEASYQSAEYGRGLYLAGAAPQHYDGYRWAEAGYHTAPDYGYNATGDAQDFDGAFVANAGAGIAAGTYLYKVWYEEVDRQGELHQGPVSKGVLVTLGAPGTVTVTIPTYRLTNKRNVRICVARSVQGATGTDETISLYRVTSTDPGLSTGNNRFVFNDPAADTVTFVDALADADLLKREPLYTNGGPRSNDASPWAGSVIAGGKGRLFWTDPVNPSLVRYSKRLKDDIALEAPVSFAMPVDPFGGRIIGIGILDDQVIVFKETAIYRIIGPGPLDDPEADAQANAFAPAQLVTSDVGCEDPASIGQTPVGLIFKSTKGIVLLGRDLQVSRIGGPVDAYNDQRIVRTTLLPDRPHIVMLTNSGRALLFDYERGQWSTFTNHEGHDACIVDGTYHYLRTDGRVFAETPGEYRDDNRHIPMLIETAWVKFAGYLQGWQRVLWAYFLGTYVSAHQLAVRFRLDYDNNWRGPYMLDVDANIDPAPYGEGAYGGGAYGGDIDVTSRYQRRIHLNQTCQSIQFRIEDVEATDDYGAAFELSELLLIGGVLDHSYKPGAARSS